MDIFLIELTDLFHWTARASGYAVVIIAIIILTQALLRSRLSAGWHCALWLVLLARLALPFGPSSALSLWNLLPKTAYNTTESTEASGVQDAFRTAGKQMPDTGGTHLLPAQAGPIFQIPWQALPVIWLVGVLIMLGGILAKNLRLWLQVHGLRPVTEQPLLELLEDCKQAMSVRTIVGLVLTDQVQSPALFGLLRPRILLPEQFAGRIPLEELRCIFLHELAHLKRGDIWLGWLAAVMQALHWFNPLIWWALSRMRTDREAAADALALRRMQSGDSGRYADTIVNLLESFARSPRLPVIAGIVENSTQIKRRLTMITKFKPPKRIETLIAVVIITIVAMATLTDAQDIAVPVQIQLVGNPVPFAGNSVPWTPAHVRADKLRVGGGIQASKLVFKTEPVYPENAKDAGIAGEAEFEVTVNEKGNVIDIWCVKGNPLLANAAADAIWQWRYSPVLMNGSPVSVSFPVVITFLPDGTVGTSFESVTKPPQNEFLNIPVPPILNNETENPEFLAKANTGFRTFEGRQYLLIGQGMTAAVVDIDRQKLRDLANAGWPVESDQSNDWIAPVVVRVFINRDGGIDGIEQEYGPKIPAIDDMLIHLPVLSPARFGAATVPSHLRFEISPPQSIVGKERQFVSPTIIPERWPTHQ